MNMLQALIVASRELHRRIVSLEVQGELDRQKETFQRLEELREASNKIDNLIAICKE